MHSVTLDSSGSPRKRTFSRGMSEDESLRSIIKETESASRRLIRSESRAGTLKRRSDSQFEQDSVMGLPEMLELQASYDEVVQELRGLEVEREALLFQVDVLRDTLEGVEELLAEAQREAGQTSLELEQEREAKKKLESMVCSLMQEVERLKEERNNKPSSPVSTHGNEGGATRQESQIKKEQIKAAHRDEKDSSVLEPHSTESKAGAPGEVGQGVGGEDEGGILARLREMVSKPLGQMPSLALDNLISGDGVLQRPYENGIDGVRDHSPDRNDSDSISAYEDASAETPEQDKIFPVDGDILELPDDSEDKGKSLTTNCEVDACQTQDAKIPENCIVS